MSGSMNSVADRVNFSGSESVIGKAASAFSSFFRLFGAAQEASARYDKVLRMSDDDLAKRGMSREAIVQDIRKTFLRDVG